MHVKYQKFTLEKHLQQASIHYHSLAKPPSLFLAAFLRTEWSNNSYNSRCLVSVMNDAGSSPCYISGQSDLFLHICCLIGLLMDFCSSQHKQSAGLSLEQRTFTRKQTILSRIKC